MSLSPVVVQKPQAVKTFADFLLALGNTEVSLNLQGYVLHNIIMKLQTSGTQNRQLSFVKRDFCMYVSDIYICNEHTLWRCQALDNCPVVSCSANSEGTELSI